MKIVIAGAGAVGTHLAKLFTREKHDITLIDSDESRMQSINANYDLLTLADDPMNISTLREAEAGKADLFISVTPDEAQNLSISMLAKQLGAKQTVARVDNYEFSIPRNVELLKGMGIDSVVYPEMLAGEEICNSIQRSWTRLWLPIKGGALTLVGVKVRKGCRLLNIPLREASSPDSPYHVVAIKRRGETLIPHGDDCLMERDVVYFMTTDPRAEYIKEITEKSDYPEVKTVFFLGGGHITERALALLPNHLQAKVFESNPQKIVRLSGIVDTKRIMCINADGRSLDVLTEEGIQHAQAFVATTSSSATNVLTCLNARKLGVRKTIAMIDNSNYMSMADNLDIGTIIDKKVLAAGKIYQRILKADVTSVKSLTIANADVAEFVVHKGSKVTRHQIKDLSLPSLITLGGMVRKGKGVLISGSTQLQEGDIVIAFCLEGGIKKLEHFFY
ncbi:MAG: Trk system potassium transporter TrkA [Alloprevotella sp.]|nr:Trk system potassium transporter TrkA [Alloprevotella sp.]